MGTGVDSDRGVGSAAKAREPCAALIFRRASGLALVGMAAFTDIVITRRRAGWPVRRVSVRSRITRQSPAYAPFVAFADVSVVPPAIASADTACRIRFITVLTPIGETRFWYRNFKFPEPLRDQMPPCGIIKRPDLLDHLSRCGHGRVQTSGSRKTGWPVGASRRFE